MTDPFFYDVFLSYSSKDKAVVGAVAERLRSDGLRVWFDEWEVKPGDSIPAKIENGLELSRVLMLCMSANAFGSDWVKLEAGTFRFRDPLNKARRLIPLRLDDAPIKGSLAQFLCANGLSKRLNRSLTMARDEAYRRVEQKHEEARRAGAKELDLGGGWDEKTPDLTELPESLGQLTQSFELRGMED